MISLLGAAVLVSQSALGFSGHHAKKQACCDVCGVEKAEITGLILALQTCPRWRARHDAAHDLRKYDWQCHPEITEVLTTALLTDCDKEVREEAAQSLKKLAACTPGSHAALQRAATCDTDWATRFWARRALAALKHKCKGACTVCGPGSLQSGSPVLLGEPSLVPGAMPGSVDVVPPTDFPLAPGTALAPPTDLPPSAPSLTPLPPPSDDDRESAPKLEGPIREGKRSDPPSRRTKTVKLIPGLRAVPSIFGARLSR
jgi:HEAT repeats